MLLIFLCSILAMIVGNIFNDNIDNVYTFAAIMKSSPYVISHSCFLFCTLLFRGEVVNCLHLFLSFNSSIYFTFISFGSNFNNVKAQISELVSLHILSAVLIFFFKFEMKNYPQFCLCIIMAVSVLSINVVTVLFIN